MNVFPASVYSATFFVSTTPDKTSPKVNINVRSRQDVANTSAIMLTMSIDEAMSLGEDLIGQARRLEEATGYKRPVTRASMEDYSPSRAAQSVFAPAVKIPDDRSDFTKDDEATGT